MVLLIWAFLVGFVFTLNYVLFWNISIWQISIFGIFVEWMFKNNYYSNTACIMHYSVIQWMFLLLIVNKIFVYDLL